MAKKIIGYLSYILAGLLFLLLAIENCLPNIMVSFEFTIVILALVCLLIYGGGFFLSQYYHNNKPMQINLRLYFILYLLILVFYTLISSMFGRGGLSFFNPFSLNYKLYLQSSINLIPFKTIGQFIGNFNSMLNNTTIFLNLIGNFIILMPMAFFLPQFFKKEQKFSSFFLTIFLIVLGLELTQLLTASGRFDIDDFILNISGATLMFFILKIRDVHNLLTNIFLLEKKKIAKKSLIYIGLAFLLIFILLMGIYLIGQHLYHHNYEEYNQIHNPRMKIIDESLGNCDQALDLFFTDELYNYYFPCVKKNKVYVDIENDQKYLITDILEGKTKYQISIDRLLSLLEFYNINYIKENKNPMLSWDLKIDWSLNGSFQYPTVDVYFDTDILETKTEKNNAKIRENIFTINLHLIAKKAGKTNLKVIIKDEEENILEEHLYQVTINNNLEVTYQEVNFNIICLNNILESFIASESNGAQEISLNQLIDVDLTKIEYSKVVKTNNDLLYVLIATTDKDIILNLDNYFKSKYKNYEMLDIKGYRVYLKAQDKYLASLEEELDNCQI